MTGGAPQTGFVGDECQNVDVLETKCLRVCGGQGFVSPTTVQRLAVDSRVLRIWGALNMQTEQTGFQRSLVQFLVVRHMLLGRRSRG